MIPPEYLVYRSRNPDDAEEITSEVVLKIVKNLRNQRGNFQAWIHKIAKNAIIDYLRKLKPETSYEELPQEPPVEDNPKEILRIDRLKEAIGHLTKEQADVMILKFIQEYNNAEISRIMGKSVGAVKVLQYRALKSLRDSC